MARIFTSGWETNSTSSGSSGVEWDGVQNTVSIVTTPVRTGTYAGRTQGGAVNSFELHFFSSDTAGDGIGTFARVYIRKPSNPSARTGVLFFGNGSGVQKAAIAVETDGTLKLFGQTTQIGSASSALSNDTWYMIELFYKNNTVTAKSELAARLNGVEFASTTTHTEVGGVQYVRIGNQNGAATADFYFDDFALNTSLDDQTSTNTNQWQNSWPGAGKVVHLRPNGAGDSNTFLHDDGSAGDTNNYTEVDEVTPDDATSYIKSVTTGSRTDLYALDNAPVSNIGRAVIQGFYRRTAVSGSTPTFWGILKKASTGTSVTGTTMSTSTVAWRTNHYAFSSAPYTSFTIRSRFTRYRDPDNVEWTSGTIDALQGGFGDSASANELDLSALWFTLDYTEATTKTFTVDGIIGSGITFTIDGHIAQEISTWEELDSVRNNLSGFYKLTADLNEQSVGYDTYAGPTANTNTGWLPIGDNPNDFNGVFDGNGKTIKGLFISRNSSYQALFGYLDGATIHDLLLLDVDITGDPNGNNNSWIAALGGYVVNSTTIYNCGATGRVVGAYQTGGLLGIVGTNSVVYDCFADCYVTGDDDFGGFVGQLFSTATITDCYALGDVVENQAFRDGFDIGGFCGENDGTITNCYSAGLVDAGGDPVTDQVGGFVGDSVGGTETNCFWDTDTSGLTHSEGGTGKTTAQMKTLTTFSSASWDIVLRNAFVNETWFIQENQDYPQLGWMFDSPFTFTVDGFVVALSSFTVDGRVAGPAFTIDGLVVERTSYTFTVDGIVVERTTKTFTVDGIVVERITKTFTVDGIIVERTTKTFTVDGIVVERLAGGSTTVDGIIIAVDYYILGDLILPRPATFSRSFVEQKVDVITLGGRTGRDIIHRKERFSLSWEKLSKAEVDAILDKVNENTAVLFHAIDRGLRIDNTLVIPYVGQVKYDKPGTNYLGALRLDLVEQS